MTDRAALIHWAAPWLHLENELYCEGRAGSGRSYSLAQDPRQKSLWRLGHHGRGMVLGTIEDAKAEAEKQEAVKALEIEDATRNQHNVIYGPAGKAP